MAFAFDTDLPSMNVECYIQHSMSDCACQLIVADDSDYMTMLLTD